MNFSSETLDKKDYQRLYRALLLPRLIEEKMLVLLRQGRISKWFSSWGQEAISVGTSMAMKPEEYMLTMHRNLGVFTTRGISFQRLFAQFQGKASGFTKGRDRSFHFGSNAFKIVGMISHLGQQMGVANGIAQASLLRKEGHCTLVFTGDGGASEGDFHEALNVASVWSLPVLFVVENNQWGLSTPSREQFNFESFVVKGDAYGMEAHSIDGNNVVEVFEKTKALAESIRRNPRPILLECKSFRVRGHEEASGTKYYPEGLIKEWEGKDPVDTFESFIRNQNIFSHSEIAELREEIRAEVQNAIKETDAEADIPFDQDLLVSDVYAPHQRVAVAPEAQNKEMRLVDAVHSALLESMHKYPDMVLMGQDIAEYGGVFKVTDGFVEKFGKERVRNTPLCESAIIGAGLGLAIKNVKSVIEMQFADFVTEGFTQIINNLAKAHWRWGQTADVVIRMPTGAGVAAGPYHSQSNEAWFVHTPGLKVVYPAFPKDAKGLLISSIEDPNPVLFFEHKKLYRSAKEQVPEGYYNLPLGKGALIKEGDEVTIVAYGIAVHWALDYLEEHPDVSADLIDLRSLVPLDEQLIISSVQKTGKAIILQEDVLIGGLASDISSLIMEHCFEALDAPVKRVGSLNSPVPFAQGLEEGYLPIKRFAVAMEALLDY